MKFIKDLLGIENVDMKSQGIADGLSVGLGGDVQ